MLKRKVRTFILPTQTQKTKLALNQTGLNKCQNLSIKLNKLNIPLPKKIIPLSVKREVRQLNLTRKNSRLK